MKEKHIVFSWSMWILAALFYSLDYFQHTAPSVLLEPIANSINHSYTTVGSIMSIYFPIYAISQIPAGYLLDKYGIRRVLSIACIIVSIGLLISTIPAITALIIGRSIIAVGSAFAFLGALKTASAWLPKSVFPIAVGLTNTIGVAGGMLGQPFLNLLITKANWQHALSIIAIFGFILAALLALFLRTPAATASNINKKQPYSQLLKDPQIWFIALYAGIMVGTVVNAFSELYDVLFLKNSFNLSTESAAAVSSMIFIGIACGGPLHGIIANFFRHKKTWMQISCLCTIVSFTCIVFSSLININVAYIYILYFITGFFVSSMLLAFSLAKQKYHQNLHAIAFAIINMTIGICGFLFQDLLGAMLHHFSGGTSNVVVANSNLIFFHGFWVLLIPLFCSFILCSLYKKQST